MSSSATAAAETNYISREDDRRRALRRIKTLATCLLLLMAVVFVLAHIFQAEYPWLSWVISFSEAAMVGALADWFAVTALFRHPLGIPIPHTAIIPANKQRVGKTMGYFVQSNFLSEEVLARKVDSLDIAGAAANWCAQLDNARRLSKEFVSLLPEALKTLDDAEIQQFISQNILKLARETPLAPALGHILRTLTSEKKHQEVIDLLLPMLEKLLQMHEAYIGQMLKEELPWYVPGFIHDKVYQVVIARVQATLSEINSDATHPLRQTWQTTLDLAVEKLINSPELLRRGEEIKGWILNNAIIRDYLNRVWKDIKEILLRDARSGESRMQHALERGITGLARGMQRNREVKFQINQWLHMATRKLVQNHKDEIVSLISDTVSRWDSATMIEKLELEVGRDLQYIRINGTLIGGLAGLAIHALSLAI